MTYIGGIPLHSHGREGSPIYNLQINETGVRQIYMYVKQNSFYMYILMSKLHKIYLSLLAHPCKLRLFA